MGTNQRILRGHLHVITVAVLHSSGIGCAKHLAPVLLICFLVKVSAFVGLCRVTFASVLMTAAVISPKLPTTTPCREHVYSRPDWMASCKRL